MWVNAAQPERDGRIFLKGVKLRSQDMKMQTLPVKGLFPNSNTSAQVMYDNTCQNIVERVTLGDDAMVVLIGPGRSKAFQYHVEMAQIFLERLLSSNSNVTVTCGVMATLRSQLIDILNKNESVTIREADDKTECRNLTTHPITCVADFLRLMEAVENQIALSATFLGLRMSDFARFIRFAVSVTPLTSPPFTAHVNFNLLPLFYTFQSDTFVLEECKYNYQRVCALLRVIEAREKQGAFIPYRDSDMTRMCRTSLRAIGSTNVVIFCDH
eukprot:c9536_g1_i1.p1 GENE.c9536_g1_i1~~c9536_g1_i1.p1  ORF type:complete len:270 (+),score=60.06 c9536_g1_i1:42-851(+)